MQRATRKYKKNPNNIDSIERNRGSSLRLNGKVPWFFPKHTQKVPWFFPILHLKSLGIFRK